MWTKNIGQSKIDNMCVNDETYKNKAVNTRRIPKWSPNLVLTEPYNA